MQSPASLTDRPTRGRGGLGGRPAGAAMAAACWAAIALAASIAPASAGYGTHRRLGMPSCSWMTRTGYPCPTCGLTTSQSAMARGQFAAAFRAHPLGAAIFLGVATVGAAGAVQAVTGRELLPAFRPRGWWLPAGALALAASWGLKVLLGMASGQLPLR